MARPPEVHALRTDDIPEAPGWLEKLVKPLTSHMTQVAQALTGQLTVKDNLAAKWVTVEVRGFTNFSSHPGASGMSSVRSAWTSGGRAIGVTSLRCQRRCRGWRGPAHCTSPAPWSG